MLARVRAELHEAVSDAVYVRTPDAAGLVALLLGQGPRLEVKDEQAYIERTGLVSKLANLEAALEDSQSPEAARIQPLLGTASAEHLKVAMAHAIFLRVAQPMELAVHLATSAVQAGEVRMLELANLSAGQYLHVTGLDAQLAAAADASGLRSQHPPADVLQKIAEALAPNKKVPDGVSLPAASSSGTPVSAGSSAPHAASADTHPAQDNATHGWTAAGWVNSISGISEAISNSLCGAPAPGGELSALRALGNRVVSVEDLADLLKRSAITEHLARSLYPALQKLCRAQACFPPCTRIARTSSSTRYPHPHLTATC